MKYKDHLILLLESGEFKAHSITAHELYEHAFKEMGEDNADESDALSDYIQTNLDTSSCEIGWTELDTADDKARLKLLDNIAELKTLLTQVK